MAFVQLLPHDPNAIDIAAIQRRKQLEIWHRTRQAPVEPKSMGWKDWLTRPVVVMMGRLQA